MVKKIFKSAILTALVLTVISCTNTIPANNSLYSQDNFQSLDKEYSFSTKAFTKADLKSKLSKWVTSPVNGSLLVKEISYALSKNPDLFCTIMTENPGLRHAIDIVQRKGLDIPFRKFLEGCKLPPSKGLIAYFPFNGNANDESGYGNNGTVFGAQLTANRAGASGKAYNFNGTSDYIFVPNSPVLNTGGTAMTVSLWVKFAQLQETFMIISKHRQATSPVEGWLAAVYQTRFIFQLRPDNNCCSLLFSGTVPVINTWYNLIFKNEGSEMKIYVNGNLDGSLSFAGTPDFGTEDINIGRDVNDHNTAYTNGIIDDIRIYNRALTDEEISSLASETAK